MVKGGFIPGATNIALFFETQLVMAVLTERVLVLPPRGGLVDHLYASGKSPLKVSSATHLTIASNLILNLFQISVLASTPSPYSQALSTTW